MKISDHALLRAKQRLKYFYKTRRINNRQKLEEWLDIAARAAYLYGKSHKTEYVHKDIVYVIEQNEFFEDPLLITVYPVRESDKLEKQEKRKRQNARARKYKKIY